MYDVIIIGAGPAGLTAAIYTARARLNTLVIENPAIASQATYAYQIDNYPGFPKGISGVELAMQFNEQAKNSGAEFVTATAMAIDSCRESFGKVWKVDTDSDQYKASSIIIASGARARPLGVAGENELIGKGVSYCATCDGAFFKDKTIVVVGGGNTAAEEALFLTRFGKKVMLIHRRDRLRAAKILQEQLEKEEKIELVLNSIVTEINGKDNRVSSITLKNVKDDKQHKVDCDGIFISVGYIPNTGFAEGVVQLGKNRHIIADDKLNTSQKGIFAAGDCRETYLRQVVTACGDGALAAFSAQKHLENLRGTPYI
jgi:thioredoxin reductase (NADPH)